MSSIFCEVLDWDEAVKKNLKVRGGEGHLEEIVDWIPLFSAKAR